MLHCLLSISIVIGTATTATSRIELRPPAIQPDLAQGAETPTRGEPALDQETEEPAAASSADGLDEVLAAAQDRVTQAQGSRERTLVRSHLVAAIELLGGAIEDEVEDERVLSLLRQIATDAESLRFPRVQLEANVLVEASCRRRLPDDAPELLLAREELGLSRLQLGDYEGAHELLEEVCRVRAESLPEDDPDRLRGKFFLASTLRRLGRIHEARDLQEAVLAAREKLLGPEHWDVVVVKVNLANTLLELGDLPRARDLQEQALEQMKSSLPDDHPSVLRVRGNLATTLRMLGDIQRAREVDEELYETLQQVLEEDNPDLLRARGNLAVSLRACLEFERARELQESLLASYSRIHPADHRLVQNARVGLASLEKELGDLDEARRLLELALPILERTLPPKHPDVLLARENLGATLHEQGDLSAARNMFETVLAKREETLPPGHLDILRARQNLAAVNNSSGDYTAALELMRSTVEAYATTVPEEHHEFLLARMNLAGALSATGDLEGAYELFRDVSELCNRTLPEGHPQRLAASEGLADVLVRMGQYEEAEALLVEVLAGWETCLPEGHPALLNARVRLASARAGAGEFESATALLEDLIRGVRQHSRAALTAGRREARALAELQTEWLSMALFLGEQTDGDLLPQTLSILETRRHLVTFSATVEKQGPQITQLRYAAATRARTLNELVLAGPGSELTLAEWRAAIEETALLRDRAERALLEEVSSTGRVVFEIDSGQLADRLSVGSVAVGFHRYTRVVLDEEAELPATPVDSLLALVLRWDGTVERIELGPAEEVEVLVQNWRTALGKPLERGARVVDEREDPELVSGTALRERVLDPVLAACLVDGRKPSTIHACTDGVLRVVPLDALPIEGGRLGDRYRVLNEVSFARLLSPLARSTAAPSLLAIGDVDFDADDSPDQETVIEAAAPIGLATRGASFGTWRRLFGTRGEVEALELLFTEEYEREALILRRGDATKSALNQGVLGRRYLHIATHGWFAPDSILALGDRAGMNPHADRLERTVIGFAPLTLCGLCLAGANLGVGPDGRAPGLLTAEELASLDLSSCQLAVLSACETNVGIERAGLGIDSLQTALHIAGARSAITSLWRVDDNSTSELMQRFYTNLWSRKLPAASALWDAKRSLREEGLPVAAWGGWVLTGDPD